MRIVKHSHANLVGNFHCQRVEAGVFLSQLNALGEVGLKAVPLLSQLDHFGLDILSLLQHDVVNETRHHRLQMFQLNGFILEQNTCEQ